MIKKKNKSTSFKTIEEYRAYYALDKVSSISKTNKYYRIGQDIARMACRKAVAKLSQITADPSV